VVWLRLLSLLSIVRSYQIGQSHRHCIKHVSQRSAVCHDCCAYAPLSFVLSAYAGPVCRVVCVAHSWRQSRLPSSAMLPPSPTAVTRVGAKQSIRGALPLLLLLFSRCAGLVCAVRGGVRCLPLALIRRGKGALLQLPLATGRPVCVLCELSGIKEKSCAIHSL
jgi:hypothetical protein